MPVAIGHQKFFSRFSDVDTIVVVEAEDKADFSKTTPDVPLKLHPVCAAEVELVMVMMVTIAGYWLASELPFREKLLCFDGKIFSYRTDATEKISNGQFLTVN